MSRIPRKIPHDDVERVCAYIFTAKLVKMNLLTGVTDESHLSSVQVVYMFVNNRPHSGLWYIEDNKFAFFWLESTSIEKRVYHRVEFLITGIPE